MQTEASRKLLTLEPKRFAMFGLLVEASARDNPQLRDLLKRPAGTPIRPLRPSDDATAFDSGVPELDDALRHDLTKAGSPEEFGCHVHERDGRIAAFYRLRLSTLVCVRPDGTVDDTVTGMPVVILPRIAVDKPCQGRGLGAALLGDALRRGLRAGAAKGASGLYIHALSAELCAFYRRFGLRPLPPMIDPQGFVATASDIALAE